MLLGEVNNISIIIVLLLVCRVTTIFLFIPGIGEATVSPKIKVLLAILCSFIIYIGNKELLETEAQDIISKALYLLVIQEIAIGFIIGIMIKITFFAMHTASIIISSEMGLSSGAMFDPAQQTQGTVISSFLNVVAILVVLTSNLHLICIEGIADSYQYIPISSFTKHLDSYLEILLNIFSTAWLSGFKIASPFIIGSVVLLWGAGILARLMPQLQIFFITIPAQVAIGLTLMITTISIIMHWYSKYFYDQLVKIFTGVI